MDQRGIHALADASLCPPPMMGAAAFGSQSGRALRMCARVGVRHTHCITPAKCRLLFVVQALKEQREDLLKLVPVKVPIKWEGSARSVRVMVGWGVVDDSCIIGASGCAKVPVRLAKLPRLPVCWERAALVQCASCLAAAEWLMGFVEAVHCGGRRGRVASGQSGRRGRVASGRSGPISSSAPRRVNLKPIKHTSTAQP